MSSRYCILLYMVAHYTVFVSILDLDDHFTLYYTLREKIVQFRVVVVLSCCF